MKALTLKLAPRNRSAASMRQGPNVEGFSYRQTYRNDAAGL